MDSVSLGLVLNAVLVVITGVYAALTLRLSKSSAAAAESAAESARAAADSARSQRAAIEAEVNRRHAWFKTGGGGRSYEEWKLVVRPLVGAYLLRRVVLRDFEFRFDAPGEDGSRPNQRVEVDRELWPEGDAVMPVPVDEVEGAWFAVNVAVIAREAGLGDEWKIANWSCEVTFSLSEFSDSQRRVIVYFDPKRDSRLQWLKQARDLGLD